MKKVILTTLVFLFAIQVDAKPRVYVKANNGNIRYVKVCPASPSVVVRPACPSTKHIWIDGDWVWNPQANQYVYIQGRWIVPAVGAVWVPGHWKNTKYGWHWINGHWR